MFRTAFCASCLLLFMQAVQASSTVLEVRSPSGNQDFTLEQLEALPQHTITTLTPYTDNVETFEGPFLSDVLSAAGAQGTELRLVALNDYEIVVPLSGLQGFDPVVSVKKNGVHMSVRNKGPIWLMLPISEHPELDKLEFHRLLIWQLKLIELK